MPLTSASCGNFSTAFAAARTPSLCMLFDHGASPRIGPRFLWQLKQRVPSSTFSTGVPPPSPSITPKSNFSLVLVHERNSTDFTTGRPACTSVLAARNNRPSSCGFLASVRPSGEASAATSDFVGRGAERCETPPYPPPQPVSMTPLNFGGGAGWVVGRIAITTRGCVSPEWTSTAEKGIASWTKSPSFASAATSCTPLAGILPPLASSSSPIAVSAYCGSRGGFGPSAALAVAGTASRRSKSGKRFIGVPGWAWVMPMTTTVASRRWRPGPWRQFPTCRKGHRGDFRPMDTAPKRGWGTGEGNSCKSCCA